MFKEKLYLDALTLYTGAHVAERVKTWGYKALEIGVEPRMLTLLFVDIAGLTQAAKERPPAQFWDAFRAHQQGVTERIYRHGGVVDSMMGDAYVAIFGLDNQGLHSIQAMDCAADLARLSRPAESGFRTIVGVNTGLVRLGNVGTAERIKYTVMGDAVNLASRLCSKCISYNVSVLVGEGTVKFSGEGAPPVRVIDTVKVHGREDMMDVYTLANLRET
jgi:adenylate cyclase